MKKNFTDEFAETRRKIEEELRAKGADLLNLEEYPGLKSKIDTAGKMLDALSKQKNQKIVIRNELLSSLSELNDLWLKEFQAIKDRLNQINNKNSALKIEAEFKGINQDFLAFSKKFFVEVLFVKLLYLVLLILMLTLVIFTEILNRQKAWQDLHRKHLRIISLIT